VQDSAGFPNNLTVFDLDGLAIDDANQTYLLCILDQTSSQILKLNNLHKNRPETI
jgi:hypothetical protein